MPPIEVLDARLSAVMLIPFVLGAMVEERKYAEPEPHMKSTEPSIYELYTNTLAPTIN